MDSGFQVEIKNHLKIIFVQVTISLQISHFVPLIIMVEVGTDFVILASLDLVAEILRINFVTSIGLVDETR